MGLIVPIALGVLTFIVALRSAYLAGLTSQIEEKKGDLKSRVALTKSEVEAPPTTGPGGPYRRVLKKPEPVEPAFRHRSCPLEDSQGRTMGRWWSVRFDEDHLMWICDGCAKTLSPDAFAAGLKHLTTSMMIDIDDLKEVGPGFQRILPSFQDLENAGPGFGGFGPMGPTPCDRCEGIMIKQDDGQSVCSEGCP
jgi:hypothetical protein